jgi:topoisomerase-4 subunit A
MRLRSLRRLEEMEIRKEHKTLTKEAADVRKLLANESLRWTRITEEIAETGRKFGSGPLGDRRTQIAGPPADVKITDAISVEREPITVILSEKGWIRAIRGHIADADTQKFKEGDRLRLLLPCETTDRLALLATNGRFYTLRAGDMPRGRGDGQAIRVMLDMTNQDDILSLFVLQENKRYLVAGSGGRGFVVPAADLIAEKRTGKQVLNLREGEAAKICVPAEGDHVAVVGENRKLLVFPLAQVPEMARGAGVTLQRYKEGGLADARVFRLADGLTWKSGERTRTELGLRDWLGERGQAGRMPPSGFPKSGKFGG